MRNNYGVARSYLGMFEVLGWIVVGLGLLAVGVMFWQGGGADGIMSVVMVGIPAALAGFGIVAGVQISRAVVDTAENTQEAVGLLSEIARASRQSPSAPAARPAEPPIRRSSENSVSYKGHTIHRTEDGYEVNGAKFASIMDAERYIDGLKRG